MDILQWGPNSQVFPKKKPWVRITRYFLKNPGPGFLGWRLKKILGWWVIRIPLYLKIDFLPKNMAKKIFLPKYGHDFEIFRSFVAKLLLFMGHKLWPKTILFDCSGVTLCICILRPIKIFDNKICLTMTLYLFNMIFYRYTNIGPVPTICFACKLQLINYYNYTNNFTLINKIPLECSLSHILNSYVFGYIWIICNVIYVKSYDMICNM